MRWLKRGVWILAWVCWAWLGVGLYRELPRELTFVRELPPGGKGMYRGFVGDSNHVLVLTAAGDGGPVAIRVFDAETGNPLLLADGPPNANFWCSSPEALRHGVLIANRQARPRSHETLHVFDILLNVWRPLTDAYGSDISVHPSRPWVVFNETPTRPDGCWRTVVMDFKTGREVFARNLPQRAPVYRNPYFLNGDRVLVQMTEGSVAHSPTSKMKNEKTSGEALAVAAETKPKHRLEVWRVADPPVLEKTIPNTCLRIVRDVAANGRLAYSSAPMEPSQGVYDLDAERTVFTHPLNDEEFDDRFHHGGLGPPKLSRSGRAVFGGNPRTLREVDTTRLLWSPPFPDFRASYGTDDQFQVLESWHTFWKSRFPNAALQTRAVRSMETGELIYRSNWKDIFIVPHLFNADRTLGVANGGRAYRMPARVNWPLVIFCQAVLALPLVVFWALVRWRRRRLERASG